MLDKIIEAAKSKNVKLSTHAMSQAADRKISTNDIINAILNHKKYVYFPEKNRFNIYGDYSEDLLLMVSGVYFEGILVITTHKISKKRVKL